MNKQQQMQPARMMERQERTFEIKERIQKTFKMSTVTFTKYIDEISNALAMGSMLRNPRTFRGRKMSGSDFARISEDITSEQIEICINALIHKDNKKEKINNRPWYILGYFARF